MYRVDVTETTMVINNCQPSQYFRNFCNSKGLKNDNEIRASFIVSRNLLGMQYITNFLNTNVNNNIFFL